MSLPDVATELANMGNPQLCERLRGLYRIPVNDGCGPLNGSNEFVRQFQTGPIQHEAARRIEALLGLMDNAAKAIAEGHTDKALEYLT